MSNNNKPVSKSEQRRRHLQSQGVPEGARNAAMPTSRGHATMTRGGEKVPVEEQLEAILRMTQEQNQQLIKEVSVHRKVISQMAGRLEGLIRVMLLNEAMTSQSFHDAHMAVMVFDKEASGVVRIKDPALRVARLALWNMSGEDKDRVPLKPFDVGILEWLADPTSGMAREDRLEVTEVLEYIDDKEKFISVLENLPITDPEKTTENLIVPGVN